MRSHPKKVQHSCQFDTGLIFALGHTDEQGHITVCLRTPDILGPSILGTLTRTPKFSLDRPHVDEL